VPAFDGARPDRLVGVGLNMYDVMAWTRARKARRDVATSGDGADWAPTATAHRRRGGRRAAAGAGRARADRGYLFYDCQTDDARLVLTVLGEAERFGAVCANGWR
jgi:glycerol-3-phosphate dehydrogenase